MLKRLMLFCGFAVLCCIHAAAGNERQSAGKAEVLLDGVAAAVNEHVITVSDVLAAVEPMKRSISAAPGTADYKKALEELFVEARDSLIDKFLILDSEDSKKVVIPDWYVDRRVNEIVKDSFGGDWDRFMDVLARDRQTFEQWRSELKDHILISSIRTMKIDQNAAVSPTEIAELYEKQKERYTSPGRIRIRMIVLERKPGAEDPMVLARKLKEQIDGGDDFAELAGQHSVGTYAEQGGDWGWIEPDILREDLRKGIDALEAGGTGIVDAGEEVYIFKVEEKRESREREFKDVQPLVERELRKIKAEAEGRAWLDVLRRTAFVKINDTEVK